MNEPIRPNFLNTDKSAILSIAYCLIAHEKCLNNKNYKSETEAS